MTENAKPSIAETDWITLLNDKARTGGQGTRPARAPSKTRWQFRTGSSIRSAPILRDGILYVTSIAGSLHAIDVASGRAKWKFPVVEQVHSTPSLCGNKVLFGCDDGKVYAVDCVSGAKLWDSSTGGEVWTSPIVRGGIVFFGSAGGRMYAVDAATDSAYATQQL